MSDDMSVFKKMKDKITDEVNSATSKLQNIQVIDQLATLVPPPHQTLPELRHNQQTDSLPLDSGSQFNSLVNIDNREGDDELNAEISPQHQLFNEHTIRRLKSPTSSRHHDNAAFNNDNNGSNNQSAAVPAAVPILNNEQSVIDIEHLSSDLEDDIGELSTSDDAEIDLLTDREPNQPSSDFEDKFSPSHFMACKAKYRDVVHALRHLHNTSLQERCQLESETKKLTNQIVALTSELDSIKQQQFNNGLAINSSESERKSNSSSPHQSSKHSSKIKDLEKLMAKCKESLKAKNTQLKILKESLSEVDKFREYIGDIKNELKELRSAHETWTLSIAENKRVVHQEIEDKNIEMDKYRLEIKDLQSQLKEGNNRFLQLKANIQSLESRLVSTSAAHQKERESLIKELTAAKNNAIKQLQREHELQLERVKLDLEKSIESLKAEILTKDEQIIRGSQRQQELQNQNSTLTTDLENTKRKCDDLIRSLNELKKSNCKGSEEIDALKEELERLKSRKSDEVELKSENENLKKQSQEFNQQVTELTSKLSELEKTNQELKHKLEVLDEEAKQRAPDQPCAQCPELQNQLRKGTENYEQSLFELNAKLNLMTTANNDQEKALQDLKAEHDSVCETIKSLRLECEELAKKNETLTQMLQYNENEMQSQQDQLNQLSSFKQQLDNVKKENATLGSSFNQVKNELNERNSDLMQSQETVDKLKAKLAEVEQAFKSSSNDLDNLKKEKELLVHNLKSETKKRQEADQHLVVNILAALKNLETPDTSPGSDKTYNSEATQDSGDMDREQGLPDPIKLAENLSSLALDKSNAYMTSNQRLQAVLLDNSAINDEVRRLKEELKVMNEERSQEVMSSMDEIERLRTENQALIHDQKAYDDQIGSLETEIDSLKKKLTDLLESVKVDRFEVATATSETDIQPDETTINELEAKNQEIEQLKKAIASCEEEKKRIQSEQAADVPSSTEFEYLKNIVLQFLMGREPITLARVISAIFNFDKDQMEQICKIQEAIHHATG